MIILDAHIPPGLALWIASNFQLECNSAKYPGLLEAEDRDIFAFARTQNAILITKDDDFISLLMRNGSPPKVLWLTCGNFQSQIARNFNDKLNPGVRPAPNY
jgi:predicted nuclease of predicted toxin-antitoxin system